MKNCIDISQECEGILEFIYVHIYKMWNVTQNLNKNIKAYNNNNSLMREMLKSPLVTHACRASDRDMD
uniref:Uncharacterized protein n=1 Tax=Arion vulgaris TaxID=1028688 RepID=A0A0B6YHW0_9EUPU